MARTMRRRSLGKKKGKTARRRFVAQRRRKCAPGSAKKGCKSKSRKGRLDYTTKKSSRYFNRKGKRQTRARGGFSYVPTFNG